MSRKATKGSFRPGDPRAGRPKGAANSTTVAVREAIALFAADNVDKLQEWLERTAEKHPDKAADLFLRALEYHIPKLARTETAFTGEVSVVPRLVIKIPADG